MSSPGGPPPPYPGLENTEKGGYPQYPQAPPYPTDGGQHAPVFNQPPSGSTPYPQQAPPHPGMAYPNVHYSQPPQQGPTVMITQPPAHGNTTVTTTTTVVQRPVFRDLPAQVVCPSCQAQVITSLHYETGALTYLLCAGICLFGCDLGCCLIPFCVDGCKDVLHTCPNCNATVGKWNRL